MGNDGRVVSHRRPRRLLSALLRSNLRCPLCGAAVRIVAFRERTCRLECGTCALRYSVDPAAVGAALHSHPQALLADEQTKFRMLLAHAANIVGQANREGALTESISQEGLFILYEAAEPGILSRQVEEPDE